MLIEIELKQIEAGIDNIIRLNDVEKTYVTTDKMFFLCQNPSIPIALTHRVSFRYQRVRKN